MQNAEKKRWNTIQTITAAVGSNVYLPNGELEEEIIMEVCKRAVELLANGDQKALDYFINPAFEEGSELDVKSAIDDLLSELPLDDKPHEKWDALIKAAVLLAICFNEKDSFADMMAMALLI